MPDIGQSGRHWLRRRKYRLDKGHAYPRPLFPALQKFFSISNRRDAATLLTRVQLGKNQVCQQQGGLNPETSDFSLSSKK